MGTSCITSEICNTRTSTMMRLKQTNKLINDKLLINRNFINRFYIQTRDNRRFDLLRNKLNDQLLDLLWAKICNSIHRTIQWNKISVWLDLYTNVYLNLFVID